MIINLNYNKMITITEVYNEWYDHYKNYSIEALDELRTVICMQVRFGEREKSEETSTILKVIDDLGYLKQYNIPL
jgi:hypothetical protein